MTPFLITGLNSECIPLPVIILRLHDILLPYVLQSYILNTISFIFNITSSKAS